MIIMVIMGYTLLAIYDILPLYKQKLWYEFWANTVLGIFSFIIFILVCLDIKIPSPEKPIREFIVSIFGK